jgi:DNA segregation ATPase FtsK/SpoIIIE, S-DNA-T family
VARKRKKRLHKDMRSQVKGIMLLALALFCYAGLTRIDQTGGAGYYINIILRTVAGEAAIVIPLILGVVALSMIIPLGYINNKTRLYGLLILPLLYLTWAHLQLLTNRMSTILSGDLFTESLQQGLRQEGGGVIGSILAGMLLFLIGPTGSLIFIVALALISVLMIFNISLKRILKVSMRLLNQLYQLLRIIFGILYKSVLKLAVDVSSGLKDIYTARKTAQLRKKAAVIDNTEPEATTAAVKDEPDEDQTPVEVISDYQQERTIQVKAAAEAYEGNKNNTIAVTGGPKKKLSVNYIYPPLDILSFQGKQGEQQHIKSSRNMASLLENTLLSFGVKARVIHVQSGPTVTRFEVQPEAGVKVSKIISLSDDLALNLAAPLVRIEAPIPGKAALGIEVPNKVITLVNLRDVMEDSSFQKSLSPLTVALGKDITGIPVIADLTKMPHLLIAGATGAGKSVCLNTIITSILYKAGPDNVRFLMIDPKVVELSIYNGIPHLLMPVQTDPRKAAIALRNMVREMGRRYDLFASLGVRDIATYNEMASKDIDLEKLSYIVVVIDELADLMLVSPGEVEDSIARLAQMSRAAGIHLLVATQRPSVDVLTGVIKANITSRIAFTVSSQVDSRTILDMAGAEKLLGNGDMLFYPVGTVKPFRVQGAYVSEDELKRITDFLKDQKNDEYEKRSTFMDEPGETEDEVDELFNEAVELITRSGQASISLLQRRFRIGYTRAARLIDDLERRGIVGPFEGSKPRQVLITAEEAAKIYKDMQP